MTGHWLLAELDHGLRSSLTSFDTDDLTGHFGAARAAASETVRSKIRLFATTNTPRETEALR
jgi:hypothetical protein